ncbi:hypothetical protein HBB16_19925 [Pseudonocardia sp. MCCB 268]|nr:hypothetical protein [Pseudonocardia cytotoxica]
MLGGVPGRVPRRGDRRDAGQGSGSEDRLKVVIGIALVASVLTAVPAGDGQACPPRQRRSTTTCRSTRPPGADGPDRCGGRPRGQDDVGRCGFTDHRDAAAGLPAAAPCSWSGRTSCRPSRSSPPRPGPPVLR